MMNNYIFSANIFIFEILLLLFSNKKAKWFFFFVNEQVHAEVNKKRSVRHKILSATPAMVIHCCQRSSLVIRSAGALPVVQIFQNRPQKTFCSEYGYAQHQQKRSKFLPLWSDG